MSFRRQRSAAALISVLRRCLPRPAFLGHHEPVTDTDLRRLHRTSFTGDLDSRAQVLAWRVRTNSLARPRLELAAFLGDEASSIATGREQQPAGDVRGLTWRLANVDWGLSPWIAWSAASHVLPLYEALDPDPQCDARRALEQLGTWLLGQIPELEEVQDLYDVLDSRDPEAGARARAEELAEGLSFARGLTSPGAFASTPDHAGLCAFNAIVNAVGSYGLWISGLNSESEALARQVVEFGARAVIAWYVGYAHQRRAPGYDSADAFDVADQVEAEFVREILLPLVPWALEKAA